MKKIIILLPVYNDWESLLKVLDEIDTVIKDNQKYQFECIIVNDSSTIEKPKILKPKNFNSLKIINMKENKGHARCNAFGLRYINLNEIYDYVIIMDSDGEDRPIEINSLVNKISQETEISVVAKRIKRSEGPIFQTLYKVHKLVTYLFTGKRINFGNYSCLTKKDVNILSDKPSLWSSFSGSVKKNLSNLNEVDSIRGLRYFGPSKMSLFNLAIHSFSIIAVFKYVVFLRSTFMIIILSYLTKMLGSIAITLQVLIVFFNLIIFIVSIRENEKALLKSDENILSENEITH
tara:strand:- start:965 stop:1837 length:873 start_codon:yes stop_codon:yes gene_type:complete